MIFLVTKTSVVIKLEEAVWYLMASLHQKPDATLKKKSHYLLGDRICDFAYLNIRSYHSAMAGEKRGKIKNIILLFFIINLKF